VAGLLVRGFNAAATVHRGFEPENVDVAAIELSQAGYTSATGLAFAQRVIDAVRAQPGSGSRGQRTAWRARVFSYEGRKSLRINDYDSPGTASALAQAACE
jgi:hypothetical protein